MKFHSDKDMASFNKTRNEPNIKVLVDVQYSELYSQPEKNYYAWSYQITIENKSYQSFTLKKRHWEITDAYGEKQYVDGEGVIGQEPVIEAGKSFSYSSGVFLYCPHGFMEGYYEMIDENLKPVKIKIPLFSLDAPMSHINYQ